MQEQLPRMPGTTRSPAKGVLNEDRIWRDGRAAEGAPLLREYTLIAYRGFESLSLRQPIKNPATRGFLLAD